ncbi:hypothetical protein GGR53DRAFT_261484 [Hypoxylon sp. FL1150]|nr:hypothetical protein GGR53DRAFT_261484 [Hypoxylon sp. FL1150]
MVSTWWCCQCNNGPWLTATNWYCADCGRQRCSNCVVEGDSKGSVGGGGAVFNAKCASSKTKPYESPETVKVNLTTLAKTITNLYVSSPSSSNEPSPLQKQGGDEASSHLGTGHFISLSSAFSQISVESEKHPQARIDPQLGLRTPEIRKANPSFLSRMLFGWDWQLPRARKGIDHTHHHGGRVSESQLVQDPSTVLRNHPSVKVSRWLDSL